MSNKLLENVGGKVADQWLKSLLSSALLFWVGVFAAGIPHIGWQTFTSWFVAQPEPLQFGLLILSLSIAIGSNFVIQRFEFTVLRALEGYWPPALAPLRRRLIRRQAHLQQQLNDRFDALDDLDTARTPEQHRQFAALQAQRQAFPENRYPGRVNPDLMPTTLGNILRAYELKPYIKYGLDAIVCWPRLWCLLPDAARGDISSARSDLNAAVRLWIWGMLFTLWMSWAWWALPVGLLAAWLAYNWMLSAAQTYGILIETAFDLYRDRLYAALRLPLPPNSAEEEARGFALTQYLRDPTGRTMRLLPRDRGEPESN